MPSVSSTKGADKAWTQRHLVLSGACGHSREVD